MLPLSFAISNACNGFGGMLRALHSAPAPYRESGFVHWWYAAVGGGGG
ncbi:hypothetical protein [Thiohalocapsa halophila]|jgi:hypothetical protein